ncbi:M4 family metallopeptidase [Micromonospora chersina]|uniref:M4 family metallopeptidase n=1 Tax=Micromonospora chersina TaxID=47854 RepID=UPI0037125BB4
MAQNGLRNFALHSNDEQDLQALETIEDELNAGDAGRSLTFEPDTADPETVARRYLNQMIASPAVPTLGADDAGGMEFRTLGTETVRLTGAKIVKFAQDYHRIPVYGSLVTVELDQDNRLLAINSAVGEPSDVDPVATVSPAQALAVIQADAGAEVYTAPPRLYFYFDKQVEPNRWRLVHMAKDVPRDDGGEASIPELVDYVVDAHTAELVARLPRTQSASWTPYELALGVHGVQRTMRLERDEQKNMRMSDTVRNVRTHDLNFQDAGLRRLLPGDFVANPPDPWLQAAISAHINAAAVADFLVDVLQRNGLDNLGGPFVSSINCTYRNIDPNNREWRNAAWIGTQMIYGQRMVNGDLRSYAVARDVVAHEIIHGLTDHTARLEYLQESGALNESYSDIFGIIISNWDPDNDGRVDGWDWQMGEDLDETGVPLRDISDPARRGQPAHMNDFKTLRPSEVPNRSNDYGWLHRNSGIHNKAAYNLLTAKDANGEAALSPRDVASLFYLALTQYLSRTSGFSDSRTGVRLAAQTYFRAKDPELLARKLAVIDGAFDAVGIRA